MVNMQSAENALKSFYLDAIKDTLDMKTSPLLAKIEHTTDNVYGKDVKKLVRVGFNGGVAVGTETGNLPASDPSNYVQLTATLKNIYGTIEISDKALRAAQSNEGAFVNLLNDEMKYLLDGAKYNLHRMIMGDGKGTLCKFVAANGNVVRTCSHYKLVAGMKVVLVDEDGDYLENGLERKLLSVDRYCLAATLDGPAIDTSIKEGFLSIVHYDEELTGIEAIFNNESIYGLTEEEYDLMKPIEYDLDDSFNETLALQMIDEIEQRSNSAPNLIVCSFGVRRSLIQYYKEKGIVLPTTEIEGGFTAITFNGIPVVVDRFCDKGMMYFLNTNDFKLCQLCDWQWMENEDGKILHQVPGKPVYTATLVKYAELICERPSAQGRIIGIFEE